MKRRILSLFLTVALLLLMVPTVATAAGTSSINYQLKCTVIMGQNSASMTATSSQLGLETDTLEAFLGVLAAGKFTMSNMELSIDLTKPCEIEIMNAAPATDTVEKKVVITTGGNEDEDDALVICSSSTVTIQPESGNWSHNHEITFSKGIEIKEGATLQLTTNYVRDGSETKYVFGDDLVVDGTLEANDPDTVATLQTMTFQNGSALKIGKTGSATLVSTNVTGGSADPLIVNEGELLIGTGAYQSNEKAPTISAAGTAIQTSGTLTLDSGNITSSATDKPLIEATGGEVNLEKSQKTDEQQQQYIPVPTLTAPSGAPAILVKENASLTAGIGNITSTTGSQPPVVVENGGALTITTDDTYETNAGTLFPTITTSGTQAVELEAGATVTNSAGVSATVSTDNSTAGDNYVDNYGNIILAAGATKDDDTLNAAVILADGTIIEGSEDTAPSVKTTTDEETGTTTTAVTVPAGGSVQKPNEQKQTLVAGGSVSSTGGETKVEETTISATGITLDKSSVTLYSNTTPNTAPLTATVTPDNSTDTVQWESSDTSVATVDANGNVTAVANGTATITATAGSCSANCTVTVKTYSSGGGGSSSSTYTVTVDSAKNGTVTVSPKNASRNTTVTITVTPDEGCELDTLTVTDASGNKLALTKKSDTQYTFTMPAGKVTVETSFTKVEEPPSVTFIDVPTSAYYYEAVEWAVENDITKGTSATTFSPEATCTRAQMVTFLWRAAGSPAPESSVNPFADVPTSAYYYDAVLWAVEKGIANGTSATTFSPDDTVTRGQTVAFLYRAASSPASSGGSFADVAADAYYAPAVQWAVANGITNGTSSTTFSPDASCTRAQIVTFLYRAYA